jgi:hypothetical protein
VVVGTVGEEAGARKLVLGFAPGVTIAEDPGAGAEAGDKNSGVATERRMRPSGKGSRRTFPVERAASTAAAQAWPPGRARVRWISIWI